MRNRFLPHIIPSPYTAIDKVIEFYYICVTKILDNMAKCVLVSGGAGFIGSHVTVELIQAGYDVIVADDMSNCDLTCFEGVKKITGREDLPFVKMNFCDEESVNALFNDHSIDAVIHFAAFKAVGESVAEPLKYYGNNLVSFMNVLQAARIKGSAVLFSSSATVYGEPEVLPVTEQSPRQSATSPYGNTKQICEDMLRDSVKAYDGLRGIALRYFNPIGAHPSALIGELPRGVPNNLVPFITQTAIGKRECLSIFGNDYPTHDGTGVRDYIHVVDLAKGHLAALDKLKTRCGLVVYNLGTGVGYSVLDMVNAFNKCCGGKVRYKFAPRRAGDVDECFASPEKAYNELGWKATKSLDDMCESTYNYQLKQLNKAHKHKA